MTLTEILAAIQSLELADKRRLIQLQAGEVAREEGMALEVPSMTVAIWSQFKAAGGAETLLRVLREEP